MDMYRELVRDQGGSSDDDVLADTSVEGLMGVYRQLVDSWTGTDEDESGDKATQSRDELYDAFGDNPPRRWFDLDDIAEFDELANRLYNHLFSRLRFDVLVERERSGTLMDFG
jgi:hypothetical protein